ncbi:homeobox protein Hox-A3 isoform X2 [Numida meleagris]|uniref:homeobox protein Hox-A3 isoform X2 n=1 Tax=Numida meleagris TaxID=8996 RepID=UPI000B3D8B85|nr:homeobox protein Hox-A3 isoform X2 [Numida meleagris]
MQKATYYDSSAIYGAYPYQGANGFTYNASQQQYPPSSSLVETEYHRPACSLQSPGSAVSHHKANDISESCMRTLPSQPLQPPGLTDPQAPPQPPPAPQAQPPPPSSASPSQNASSNPAPANPTKSPALNSPTVSKQIFPWMKESRQNTKQKNSSSSSGKEGILAPSQGIARFQLANIQSPNAPHPSDKCDRSNKRRRFADLLLATPKMQSDGPARR